jgi:hypothetical protein
VKDLSVCHKDSGTTGAVSNLKTKLQLPDHSNAVKREGRSEDSGEEERGGGKSTGRTGIWLWAILENSIP